MPNQCRQTAEKRRRVDYQISAAPAGAGRIKRPPAAQPPFWRPLSAHAQPTQNSIQPNLCEVQPGFSWVLAPPCRHSHIPTSLVRYIGRRTSSTRCHRAAAAGLSIFNHPLLGAARARLRRQAALAGRSCAARLRAIKYWCEADSSAKAQPASRDLCARISPARVCDSHTERHSERSVTLMISL